MFRAAFALIFYTFFRGRVYNKRRVPRTGAVLLVSNHQSHVDPVVATLALPRECHYVARDTLFTNPIFGRVIRRLNAFPIKRGTADVGALKEMLRRLRRGCAVTIFPEGTRSKDGALGAFRPNALAVAKKAGVMIVPVTVSGAFQALPRGSILPRPRRIKVAYCEPITAEQVAECDEATLSATIHSRIAETLEALNRGETPA
ncbi:MAG: 1-acyl-sn-glycerol-3-phosphate acyltransferase [Phycisphaerales bacterium]|nr:1-acyl-sn-glycerol-3-phosphate acyltransferase [Phycisphaerales bacterium]